MQLIDATVKLFSVTNTQLERRLAVHDASKRYLAVCILQFVKLSNS